MHVDEQSHNSSLLSAIADVSFRPSKISQLSAIHTANTPFNSTAELTLTDLGWEGPWIDPGNCCNIVG